MSGKTFQVFTRQILAVPMEGGWFIAEKVTAGTIHSDEVTTTECMVKSTVVPYQ